MLKKILFTLSISTALSMPMLAQAATLSDSISFAIMSHPQMTASEAALEQASKNIKEQRSSFFPTVSLDASTGRFKNNDETTRGATAGNGAATSWLGEGTISVTQPVFAGFANWNRVLQAKDRYSSAEYDLDAKAGEIALRAARAHMNFMRTKELLELSKKTLSKIKARKEKIALMVKGGAVSTAELLQADEAYATTENTYLTHEESFRQAEADYIEVVGGLPDSTLEFGDTVWNTFLPPSLEEAVSRAIIENPRVLASIKMSDSMRRDVDIEQASLLPSIDATVSYMQKDQRDQVGGESNSAKAMMKLGWNFSTGGRQTARIAKVREKQREARARREDIIRNVKRDVQRKYASMITADKRFSLFSEKERVVKKLLKNLKAQFKGGKQSNLQLISAESKMLSSKTERLEAYYGRLLTRFELLNSMGRMDDLFRLIAGSRIKEKG